MKIYILGACFAGLLLTSCNKSEDDVLPPIPAVVSIEPDFGRAGDTVVISGKNFGTLAVDVSVTFANEKAGKIIALNDSILKVITPTGSATGPATVVVKDKTITTPEFSFYALYMFGGTKESTQYQATVWRDGVATIYSDKYSDIIEGIVVDNDVHVVGYEYNDAGYPIATYWKNGNVVEVSGITETTLFTGIAVSGGDVYISGIQQKYANLGTPVYWKNGEIVILEDTEYGNTTDIQVYGSDVYVAGGNSYATYWKNGVATKLYKVADNATAISVVDGDVYVTGERQFPGITYAMYWKNGVETVFDNPDPFTYYGTKSILVVGPNVYIGGSWADEDYGYAAKFWKNGEEQTIKIKNTFVPFEIREISEYRGDIFMTMSSYTFNASSYVYRNGQPIFSSSGFHQLVLDHQIVPY